MVSPNSSTRHGVIASGRPEVDDAAAHGDLAGLFDESGACR
jgi:hypothetical protein